jgi:uncharacterized protein
MKQILVVHGGTTFSSYDKYLNYLRTKKVQPERLIYAPGWKETLQEQIGTDTQVLLPSMPNGTNAQYTEWKLWFDRIAEIAEDGIILVGHSLGGIFLAKYLSENIFPKKIAATILIAAPYDDESEEDLGSFALHSITDTFRHQAGSVTCFYGVDDPVVSIDEMDKYQSQLPKAEFVILPAPDHFARPEFPELIHRLHELSLSN